MGIDKNGCKLSFTAYPSFLTRFVQKANPSESNKYYGSSRDSKMPKPKKTKQ